MAFELKDGQGTLHKNDKDGVDSRPDYRGELNVGGQILRISGWIKDGAKGKWMSLSAQPKEDRPATPPAKGKQDDDEDIPF